MKKTDIIFVTFVFACISLFAENYVSPEILQSVKEEGVLQNVFLTGQEVKLTLVPDSELGNAALTHWENEEKPRLTTEKLFYLDKQSLEKDVTINDVSRIIRSISTMKGSEYYSNRHKKWETLYHEAHLIKSKDDKSAIPDDVEGSAEGKILYCMQDDNSFGNCYYQLNYRQLEDEVSVCFSNFESLKFGPITAAKKNNVKINLVVIDEGDHFLVYLLVQAYYPRIAFLEEKMIDSFNARVDSIYKWFVREAKK